MLFLLIFILCISIGIAYVGLIRLVLKRHHKVSSPFQFGPKFFLEWKKFGYMYLFADVSRFVIEWLIIGAVNAVVMRIVAMLITVTTSGFFGRWREFIIKKVKRQSKHHLIFKEYLGDTFAGLVFWVPMYAFQLLILKAFHLIHRDQFTYSIGVSVVTIVLFGRLGCYVSDLLEKYVLRKG